MALPSGPIINSPFDTQSVSYGYTGQMAPETAIKEQALNRRRLIANMLMQRGLQQGPGGKMVGRFYVPDSPLQGVGNLATGAIGAWLAKSIDKQQDEAMKADRQMVIDARNAWNERFNPKYQNPAESAEMPPPPPPPPPQATQEPPPPPPSPEMATEPFRGIAPRPDGPYDGQVGAVPMPEPGVQAAQPASMPPPVQLGGENTSRRLGDPDMAQAAPADMGQMIQPPAAPPPQPVPGPAPAAHPVRMVAPPVAPKPTMADLADLLTHQHPQVRAYGAALMQQMQKEQEAERDQTQRKEDFAYKKWEHETPSASAKLSAETQRDLVGAKLDQAMMMGLISKEQRDQMMALTAKQNELSADIKKSEIETRAETARQHDETLKTIARMNVEGRKDLAATKGDAKQEAKEQAKEAVMGTIAQLRDSYNQLREMGAITDTTKSGLSNMGASGGSSSVGQTFGRMFGTKAQSQRNTIEQLRNPLIAQIIRATGASAQSLNSNMELQSWLKSATDPTLDYQTNMRALDNLERIISSGKLPGEAGRDTTAPPSGGPAKVTSDAEFDALPSGTVFVGPDGKTRRKP